MKTIVIKNYGGPEVLEVTESSIPFITEPSQVLVKVRATSVNPLDYQVRRGDYASHFELPLTTGHDIAGDVITVGEAVKKWKAGDKVYYSPRFGGTGSYAEYHITDESSLSRMPDNLSYEEAAAIPLIGGTVWEMLVVRAQIKKGDRILILGGAGGVGSLAIQVAKSLGAYVYTTGQSILHEKLQHLGADVVIDHHKENWVKKIQSYTSGKGVDVIIDTVGGSTLSDSPLALADYGAVVTLVDIAQPQNLIHAWEKNATYHFVFTRQSRDELHHITQLIETGQIKPVIDSIYPLEEIQKAHQRIEDSQRDRPLLGKIVLSL
ncbi:NADPH:quinone reductase-like Zn-dependent oxidoreductase [Chryseobacterium sediminis]|uniref:NADPH:quinone reductase-like Zn-dependent oxidoreductase n=1 Tax=Chryseobacterium sediminis TaxID=1679494 RepID=A0ABR6Q141_9FLAO|nr:zinc-binding dehydrogenase [Chryseobacterium sediminis]MBB6330992.1 NADPH:quinone reductase-like Zn-dependent oxidoreductase [Chryseobacterium sediminis]